MRLCVSDAHDGLRQAIATVLGCPWQRCTVHFLRDMLGHVAKVQQPMIAAAIRGIFQATSLAEARQRLVEVVDRLQPATPKVTGLLEAAESDLLAFYQLPREHWSKLRSTNPLERVNREIGRRTDVVGIFPNDAALLRLVGALLIARRYLSQESLELVLIDEPGTKEATHDDPQLHHVMRLDHRPWSPDQARQGHWLLRRHMIDLPMGVTPDGPQAFFLVPARWAAQNTTQAPRPPVVVGAFVRPHVTPTAVPAFFGRSMVRCSSPHPSSMAIDPGDRGVAHVLQCGPGCGPGEGEAPGAACRPGWLNRRANREANTAGDHQRPRPGPVLACGYGRKASTSGAVAI